MIMNEKVYDVLKFFGRLIVPGIATLYAALASIWGFPYGEAVTASATAICVFLNAILEYCSYKYHEAEEEIEEIQFELDDEEEISE